MVSHYEQAFAFGLKIKSDKFGGFGLVNSSCATIPEAEIKNRVGLVSKSPKYRTLDSWSLTHGGREANGWCRKMG